MFCPMSLNIFLLAFAKDNNPVPWKLLRDQCLHQHMIALNLWAGMEPVPMNCSTIEGAAHCSGDEREGGNGDLAVSPSSVHTNSVPAGTTGKQLWARQGLLSLHRWDHRLQSCLGRPQMTTAPYLVQQLPLRKQLPVTLQLCPSVPSWGSGLTHAGANLWSCSCKKEGKKSAWKEQGRSLPPLLATPGLLMQVLNA